jgi:uncharacterized repeat protein (TIGR02543 family)
MHGRARIGLIAAAAILLLSLIASSCRFSPPPLDNPSDPKSSNFQGYTGAVTAVAADGQVTLLWSIMNGNTFKVYYKANSTTAGKADTQAASSMVRYNNATVTGLTNGVQYAFAVTEMRPTGESGPSVAVTATPFAATAAPPSPTGLAVWPSTGGVSLSWAPVPGAISYDIYYKEGPGGASMSDTQFPSSMITEPNSAWISGLTDGSTYSFVIVSVNARGSSAPSAAVTATVLTLKPPTNLVATPGPGMVTLNWISNSGGSCNVYYKANSTTASISDTQVPSSMVFGYQAVITGLTNGVPYGFVVTATDASGTSDPSAAATATPYLPTVPPSAPTGLGAGANNGFVYLGWQPVAGASSYNVYYRPNSTTAGTIDTQAPASMITNTSATVTGLAASTQYAFVVTAVNSVGMSAASAPATATTPGSLGQVATPTFSLPSGSYSGDQYVYLYCSTPGAMIHYTTDGSAPNVNSPSSGSGGAIYVQGDGITTTVQAMGILSGWTNSLVASATYTIHSRFRVIYNGNGSTSGSVPVDGNTYVNSNPATIMGNTGGLLKTGFAFAGWNSQADGSGINYLQGDIVTVNSDLTLYARWSSGFRITTVAGIGDMGYGGDGGPAVSAAIGNPNSIAFDLSGNMYIADTFNGRIRKVLPGGTIGTIAGTVAAGYTGEGGPATSATLPGAQGVVVDASGNTFISAGTQIYKVDTSGTIRAFAGNGSQGYSGDSGQALLATLYQPYHMALDLAGNLYFSDARNYRIRKVATDGIISTVAGNGSSGFSGDGGPANAASIGFSPGIALDASGNLYIADMDNHRIRKVSGGIITTIAGNGGMGYSGDGGPATSAALSSPYGIAVDPSGNVYFVDGASFVRKIATNGTISTVAGRNATGFGGDGEAAISALLNSPSGLAIDPSGRIYIADYFNDRIRMLSPP